jgi:hypothetical protein
VIAEQTGEDNATGHGSKILRVAQYIYDGERLLSALLYWITVRDALDCH